MAKEIIKAVAYLRTSSQTNVDKTKASRDDKREPVIDYKDSDKRQRDAIEAFARANGFAIVDEYYDKAVSGVDPVGARPAFADMLERLLSNGAKTIIVGESPDRFARDLMVQLAGHDMLKERGITLIAASSPTHFIEDTPTAVLVRQVLGAIAQFDKTTLVAKLAAARRRKRKATGQKVEGRKSHIEERPEVVALDRSFPLRAGWRQGRFSIGVLPNTSGLDVSGLLIVIGAISEIEIGLEFARCCGVKIFLRNAVELGRAGSCGTSRQIPFRLWPFGARP